MSANKHITNAKVILFVGAGASKPLGKCLMGEFVDKLFEHRSIKGKDLKRTLNAIVDFAGRDLESILEKIDSICSREYFDEGPGTDFIKPRVAAELKLIESGFPQLPAEGFLREWIDHFPKHYATVIYDCFRLREIIGELIFEHYGTVDRKRARTLYLPLFNSLFLWVSKDNPVLPVFTTNYDLAIENSIRDSNEYDIITGFRSSAPDYVYDRSEYDSMELASARRSWPPERVVLFKLHGSVFWFKDTDGSIKYTPLPQRIVSPGRNNVLIYPATKKIALEEPFFTAYDYLQRCLDNAHVAIFIGYSFRDYDTLTKIKSALRFNDMLRLIIFDPEADKLIEEKFPRLSLLETARIWPLNYKFGEAEDERKYLPEIRSRLMTWFK